MKGRGPFFYLQRWACKYKQNMCLKLLRCSLSCEAFHINHLPEEEWYSMIPVNLVPSWRIRWHRAKCVHGVLTSCVLSDKDFEGTADVQVLPVQRLMKRCCSLPRISLSSRLLSCFWRCGRSNPLDLPPSGLPGQPVSQLYLETPQITTWSFQLSIFSPCVRLQKCLQMFEMREMTG